MNINKQILLYTPLLIASMTGKAQTNIDLRNKWRLWENHPIYSFWKFISDTNTSMNNVGLLQTRGNRKGIIGISYPMFQLNRDSITLSLHIKYKTTDCKYLIITFHSIGRNAKVVSSDTISMALSNIWTDYSYDITCKSQFSLEVTIESEGTQPSKIGNVSIASFDLLCNGKELEKCPEDVTSDQLNESSVKTWQEFLLSSTMNKCILALGETVHRTESLNNLASDIIKERIIRHNCKLVLLEIPLSMGLYLNRYIKNDERYTLDFYKKYIEPLTTHSLIPLFNWIKQYNHEHNNEVTLLGIDGDPYSFLGKMSLCHYIDCANTGHKLDSLCYNILSNPNTEIAQMCIPTGYFPKEDSLLLQYCLNNIKQYDSVRLQFAHRDEKMVDTFQKIYDAYAIEKTTVTLYTHFMHSNYLMTSGTAFIHNSPSMGYYMKQLYGNDYACLALSTYQGSTWFNDAHNELVYKPIQQAPYGSIEYAMTQNKNDTITYLSTADFSTNPIYKIRYIGIFYSPDQFSYWILKESIDGIVCTKSAGDYIRKPISAQKYNQNLMYNYMLMLNAIKKRIDQ